MGNERVNEVMRWNLVDEMVYGISYHSDSHVGNIGESNSDDT
jgi:hypothetical protein